FHADRDPTHAHCFPTRRSSDLYETIIAKTDNHMIIYAIPALTGDTLDMSQFDDLFENDKIIGVKYTDPNLFLLERLRKRYHNKLDRKSTRLNSSHVSISYAVFS